MNQPSFFRIPRTHAQTGKNRLAHETNEEHQTEGEKKNYNSVLIGLNIYLYMQVLMI